MMSKPLTKTKENAQSNEQKRFEVFQELFQRSTLHIRSTLAD